MKIALLTLAAVLLLLPSTASAATAVYDDFSGPSPDTTKWTEQTDAAGYPAEHYVNEVEGRFHILEDTERDSEHQIVMTRQMVPGEILEYELYYNSGSGNRIHRAGFNNFDGTGIGYGIGT